MVSTEAPDVVRYVGQTCRRLHIRIREHRAHALRGKPFPVNRWVRKVFAAGFDIDLVVLEANAIPGKAEVRWIALLREQGLRLVNATAGGPGVFNPPPEVREKMAATHRGKPKSPEHRAKLQAAQKANPSLGFKGHKHTEEAKRRFTRAGTVRSAETRAKVTASLMGHRHSEATKIKIWVSRRARAAERAAAAVSGYADA